MVPFDVDEEGLEKVVEPLEGLEEEFVDFGTNLVDDDMTLALVRMFACEAFLV